MQQLENFAALGLTRSTLDALEKKGFKEPTEIQAACIPLLLKQQCDVVGQAQTGTGKTAAFGLPILEIVDTSSKHVQALILSPTRELAVQVAAEIESMKGERELNILPVYGGSSMDLQVRRLRKGVNVVVGTPGRVLDHIRRGTLDLSHLQFAVLDEADEMLNMGFIEDIESILSQSPEEKRMLLFSATMPKQILSLAKQFMKDYSLVKIESKDQTANLTDQHYYQVREKDKIELLCRLIDIAPDFYGLVFCRTKMQSDEVSRMLIDRGYNSEAIHGDLAQKQREIILHKFRERRVSILVATDVAARGIDVQDLTHVINYTIPQNPETYVHRIGRTGRAGKSGSAITFVTPSETRRFTFIKRSVGSEIEKEIVPDARAIVAIKRERILDSIISSVDSKHQKEYTEMAQDLLEITDPGTIVTTLLEKHYGSQLQVSEYRKINAIEDKPQRQKNSRYDDDRYASKDNWSRRKGESDRETRLFIARGFKHGMTKRVLVDFIKEHTRVSDAQLNDVKIMQDFSFVTADSDAAKIILSTFSDLKNDGKPVITRAKPDNPNGRHLAKFKGDGHDSFRNRREDSRRRSGKPDFKKGKRSKKNSR
ncbi:MAG: DEAD/DEAH box helicase [Sphaerochaetaceae bacterium]|nr:DEAD/DEAH box helicase [Sphaerochaetaceae bacterium]